MSGWKDVVGINRMRAYQQIHFDQNYDNINKYLYLLCQTQNWFCINLYFPKHKHKTKAYFGVAYLV